MQLKLSLFCPFKNHAYLKLSSRSPFATGVVHAFPTSLCLMVLVAFGEMPCFSFDDPPGVSCMPYVLHCHGFDLVTRDLSQYIQSKEGETMR
jgi:hypothetical protein